MFFCVFILGAVNARMFLSSFCDVRQAHLGQSLLDRRSLFVNVSVNVQLYGASVTPYLGAVDARCLGGCGVVGSRRVPGVLGSWTSDTDGRRSLVARAA